MPTARKTLYVVVLGLLALLGETSVARAVNPIIWTAYSADPSAHVFGGRMYVYPSHDLDNPTGYNMNDYHVYSSDDMANWQDHGVILSLAQIPWAKACLWAPDCNYKNGTYYLYFPAQDAHSAFQIGVATSKSPTGPFVAEPQPIAGASGIDPSIFIDDDGTPYLIWAGAGPTLCKLTPDMKSLQGTPIHLQGCDQFFEGPWIFKRAGFYYVTYPAFLPGGSGLGGNGQNYDYATATNIEGPYTYHGAFTRTLASQPDTGNIHGSQVEWHGAWYCFYHDCLLSNGMPGSGFRRNVRVDRMTFNADNSIAPLQWTLAGVPKIKNLDPFRRCEAECLCQTDPPGSAHSVQTEACSEGGIDVGSISDGSWIRYANADFGSGATTFTARVASPVPGSRIELHLDSRSGPLVGTCSVPNTGGWQTWQTVACPVTGAVGLHDLFLTFHGGSTTGGLLNFDWFRFGTAKRPRDSHRTRGAAN